MANTLQVKVPILTYHSIDESGSIVSTAPGVFRAQMKSLKEQGYRVVSLKDLIAPLAAGQLPEQKTVALTFDDGFENFYTEAYPVLAEHDFQATVFLVTDYCGKYNDWGDYLPRLKRSRLLSWPEIKQLHRNGIEFGTHTRTHPDLTKLSAARVAGEISESKRAIEDALGENVSTFAYPYGKFNLEVKKIAEQNVRAACSTLLGKAGAASDLFSLERIDTYYLSNLKIFNLMPSHVFDGYMRVRRAMRDFKTLFSKN